VSQKLWLVRVTRDGSIPLGDISPANANFSVGGTVPGREQRVKGAMNTIGHMQHRGSKKWQGICHALSGGQYYSGLPASGKGPESKRSSHER